MKLKLDRQHLSLLPFEIDVPKFTLITGLNGSGKSQLLKAINEGQVNAFEAAEGSDSMLQATPGMEIAYFGPNDFAINPNSNYENFNNLSMRENAAALAETSFKSVRESWEAWGTQRGLTSAQLRELTVSVHTASRGQRGGGGSRSGFESTTFSELSAHLGHLSQAAPRMNHSMSMPGSPEQLINHAAQKWGLPHYLLGHTDVIRGLADPTPFFNASVSAIFSRYRDRLIINRLLRQQFEDEGVSDRPSLDNIEFVIRYGRAPWVVLNETLSNLNLDAQFEPPQSTSIGDYHPILRSSSGAKFYPAQLSSGEQIILNLALLGYHGTANEETIRPKIVLLDEVDAPLHPAMAKTYLDVLDNILVKEFGMCVIASTHSPSTAALFPGETIHVMKKGANGLQEQAKSSAIVDLLSGVPALSVALEDRRQVFAESPVEAENLEALYRILRSSIASPLSLQFIATGSKHDNSGRDVVQRIVSNLDEAGNKTVLGLIDWDGKNVSTRRIKVLAEGRRYSLENVVMDPLVVALAVYRLHPSSVEKFGLLTDVSFLDLAKLEPKLCQRVVGIVAERVLGSPATDFTSCAYQGGSRSISTPDT
jgi:energy-coupling factor transporter ATP-binding protein EcfA2